MTTRLSAALYYLRKTVAALLAIFAILPISAGIAFIGTTLPELWGAIIGIGISLLPTAVALWTYPRHANLFGLPLVILPASIPVASYLSSLYDFYPEPQVTFANWFAGAGILWLVPIAAGVCLLVWPLRKQWRPVTMAGSHDLRRWLIPIAFLILGGFAFQGLLSLLSPSRDDRTVQRGSYATVVIGDTSVEVVLGMTPEQSTASARQLCPNCKFFGPEPGRCVGYINFIWYKGLYSIAQNTAEAEAGAFVRCSTRFASDACRLVQSKCAGD